MKTNKDDIVNKEVEKTLHALDGLKPLTTDDFFYARLEQRLQKKPQKAILHSLLPRFTMAAAAAVLLLFLNVFSIIEYSQSQSINNESRDDLLEAIADEYIPEPVMLYNIYGDE